MCRCRLRRSSIAAGPLQQLAALLGAESPSRTEEVVSGPPLHFIFSDLASAMSLRHFTAQWGAAQPVHALIPEQPGGRFDPSDDDRTACQPSPFDDP